MTKKFLQSFVIAIFGLSLISSCSYLGLEKKACAKTEKCCKKDKKCKKDEKKCEKGKKCDKNKK